MKLRSPAVARNVEPIKAVLAEWLPASGTVLEVASGTGEHALAFSRAFPDLSWQPSDADPTALASIEAWSDETAPPNLRPAIPLDVLRDDWPIDRADAVLAINLVHISPWTASLALLRHAARLLPVGGRLILYGPWRQSGESLEPSNVAFDRSLQERDPGWGLREIDVFAKTADEHGLVLIEQRRMPAHNRMLLFRREKAGGG